MADWAVWLSMISSFAAAIAAVAAWRISKSMQRAMLADLVMQIRNAYAAPEMLAAMMTLVEWKREHGSGFAKTFGDLWRSRDPKAEPINRARRRFAHQFHTLKFLLDGRLITRDLVKKVVPVDEVDFLLGVVEPLERELPTFKSTMVDLFRNIYESELGATH